MKNKKMAVVISETSTGLNNRIKYGNDVYTNTQAYNLAVKGKMPGYHGVNKNGTKFIQSDPDGIKSNNLG